jgi:hypothetical protein
MEVVIAPVARQQFFDNQGNVAAGMKLFVYEAGTTTKANTYTTSAGSVANSNPITLDSAGRTPNGFWLTEDTLYKFVLAPANDTDPPASPVWTEDNVQAADISRARLADTSDTAKGDAMVGMKRTATSAAATTLHAWLEAQAFNVKAEFGAAANGIADDTAEIQAAIDAANTQGGGIVFLPRGTYLISATLTLYSKVILLGEGYQSVIKLANTSNCEMLRTNGFATLSGSNSWLTSDNVPYQFGIVNLRFDGNRANQSITSKTITGATAANPVVITSASHGLANGTEVYITGVVGMVQLNGRYFKVANAATNTFELQTLSGSNVDGSAYTAYSSGGRAVTPRNAIAIYGKGYVLRDLLVHDAKGVGIHTECAAAGGQTDQTDMPESSIDNVKVWKSGSANIVYNGPHDGHIISLYPSLGGQDDNEDGIKIQAVSGVFSGVCDIAFIHSYGNNGKGVYANTRIKASRLIGETNVKEGIYLDTNASQSQIGVLEAYDNDSADARTYYNVKVVAAETQIGVARITLANQAAGGIQITGANTRVSDALIKDTLSTQSAIGADIDAGAVAFKGKIADFNGTTATGLRDSQSGALSNLNLDVFIESCTTHWNHANASNGSFYKIRMASATSGQTMFTGSAPDTSGRESWIVRGANSADATTQRSRNRGTGTIPNGSTSVTITHGLIATPQEISITPTNNFGTATGWYVSNIGATTFDVNSDADPGAGTGTFKWAATIDGGA